MWSSKKDEHTTQPLLLNDMEKEGGDDPLRQRLHTFSLQFRDPAEERAFRAYHMRKFALQAKSVTVSSTEWTRIGF
jgi:hypothetical protein